MTNLHPFVVARRCLPGARPQALLLTVLSLLLALLVPGCRPREGRVVPRPREMARADFEGLAGWAPAQLPQLSTERAHSGRFALVVDAQHPYSATFRATLGQLLNHRPRRLTLGAWVWVPDFADEAVLILSISNPENPDNPVFRQEIFLNDSRPFGAWKSVSQALDLPRDLNISSRSQLVIYLYAKNVAHPVYADDLLLTELW